MTEKVVIGNAEANMSPGDFIYRVEIDHEVGAAHVRVDTIARVHEYFIEVRGANLGRSERLVRLDRVHTTPEAALLASRIDGVENIRQAYEIIYRERAAIDRGRAAIDRELAALKSIDALIEGTTTVSATDHKQQ